MKPLIAMLCLLPALAPAADLYRCASSGGQVSYQQSSECPRGQRLHRVIAYQPVPDSTPLAIIAASRSKPVSNASHRVKARNGKHVLTDSERCRIAKQKRTQAFERLGLKRTYEDLGRLDTPVRAACRW